MTQHKLTKNKNSIHWGGGGGNHLHVTFLVIKLMYSRKYTTSKRQCHQVSSFSWMESKKKTMKFLANSVHGFFFLCKLH